MALLDGFLTSLARFPERPALFVDGRTYSYAELAQASASLAAVLPEDGSGLIGVLASRSFTAYRGVLAALWSGHGYVPLNLNLPLPKVAKMLIASGTRTWIVGAEYAPRLAELRQLVSYPLHFILPDTDEPPAASPAPRAGEFAYVMFTSGSTGEPKGIWVTQANVQVYLDWACAEYRFTEHDRFSQTFDLTFDPSVHDLFGAWSSGASVHCLPVPALLTPLTFIRQQALSCWYSVPSIVTGLMRLRALTRNSLPSLRLSLFVGEQLHVEWAKAWRSAASNGRLDNVYGPTETTVTITAHTFTGREKAIVPIGRVNPGQKWRIVDEHGKQANSGELWLGGPQVSLGYRNDPQKDAERFFVDQGERWYRSGDLVRDPGGGKLEFVGRIDNQVKVRGMRVDLAEVDELVRSTLGCLRAVTIAWPLEFANAPFLYVFLYGAADFDEEKCLSALRGELPSILVPRRVFALEELPLNQNRKVDRERLVRELEKKVKS